MNRSEHTGIGSAGLLEMIRQSYKTDEAEGVPRQEEAPAGQTLPDGYVRRSPVQPYRGRSGSVRSLAKVSGLLCALILVLILIIILVWRFILH